MNDRSEKTGALLSRIEIVTFIGFAFFIIPLSFIRGTVDPAISVRFCLLAGLVAFLAIMGLVRVMILRQPIEGVPVAIVSWCAAYCLACAISISQAINKSESIVETAKIFLVCGFIWFASGIMRRSPERIGLVARSITLCALVISALGILEYWGVLSLIDTGNVGPGATMINRNLLSSFLFLCFGFIGYTVISAPGLPWRFCGFFAGASVSYLFLATQTRAVWLGLLGGICCAVIIAALLKFPCVPVFLCGRKKTGFVFMVLFGIILFIALLWKPVRFSQPSLTTRMATIVDSHYESNRQRLLLWRKTAHMALEHPVLGVGPGNWKIILPQYGIGDLMYPDMNIIEIRPYNDFLWVLAETGTIGCVLYCGLFILAGLSCIRAIRTFRDRETSFLGFSMLFALLGFAIISFFDFPKERIEHLVIFGTILSVCSSITPISLKSYHRSSRLYIAVTGLFLTGAIVCLWIGFFRIKGDLCGAQMRDQWSKGKWSQAIVAADKASSALYTLEPTSTPLLWYRGTAQFKLGNINQAFIDYRKAQAFHPWHLNALNDLGTCHSLTGEHLQAIICYSKALSVSPLFEPGLINLAAVYYNLGQIDSAYTIISRCKSPHRDPRYEPFFRAIELKINKGRSP
jgi:O-antigen ligase